MKNTLTKIKSPLPNPNDTEKIDLKRRERTEPQRHV